MNEGWRGGAFGVRQRLHARVEPRATGRYGQGIAAFMLGLPTNSSFIETAARAATTRSSATACFVHDDWRVSDRLTLNLGVRYDLEMGMTEAENRNVRALRLRVGQPDPGGGAQARYAANPPAGVPLSARRFRRARWSAATQYLSDDQAAVWDADTQQRPAAHRRHLQAERQTVLRGGIGLFVGAVPDPGRARPEQRPINQFGYSRNTPVPVTDRQRPDVRREPVEPAPERQLLATGRLEPRPVSTNLGGSPGTVFLDERNNPTVWRYSIGVERELPGQIVVEISLSRSDAAATCRSSRPLNYVPQAYRTQSAIRDDGGRDVPHADGDQPVPGPVPRQPGVNGATIARRRLLLQYPQFDTLSVETLRAARTSITACWSSGSTSASRAAS